MLTQLAAHDQKAHINRDRLLNIHQLMEKTSMGRSFLFNEMAEGRIKPVKVGRHNRFVESEIDQWIADRIASR